MYKSNSSNENYEKDLKKYLKDLTKPERKKPKKTLKQLFILKNPKLNFKKV
tara:strand:+ start:174 stop:326 length:153 start_codon:yes stop_codon:yes gene_type:complete